MTECAYCFNTIAAGNEVRAVRDNGTAADDGPYCSLKHLWFYHYERFEMCGLQAFESGDWRNK